MFSWLNAREASQFGHSLADFFAQRVPPEAIPATEKKPLRKTGEVIAKMHTKLIDYRSSHKLNVLPKGQVGKCLPVAPFRPGLRQGDRSGDCQRIVARTLIGKMLRAARWIVILSINRWRE